LPTFFDLTANQLGGFILVFMRSSGIFFLTPVIGSKNVPVQIKIGLSLFLAIVAFPFIKLPTSLNLDSPIMFALAIGKELSVGLLIGYVGLLFFSAILIAGQLIDLQMGFGLVNVIDPMQQIQVPVMGQLKYLIAVLIFLSINGHHWFITALSKSFQLVPIGTFSFTPRLTMAAISSFTEVFALALKLCAPIVATLLLVDIALGILARTMPQMNVFIVGFPVKIAMGLATFILILPFMSSFMIKMFEIMQSNIFTLIKIGGG
jgi:flagellar biosynthetic protein FliR